MESGARNQLAPRPQERAKIFFLWFIYCLTDGLKGQKDYSYYIPTQKAIAKSQT